MDGAGTRPRKGAGRERSSRKDQAQETRRRIFRAAADLFGTDGYHATSVDRIAAHAGVAKGTFFLHFPTKQAVVEELVRQQVDAARGERAAALRPGAELEVLRATVMSLGSHAARSRTLSQAVIAAGLQDPALGGATTELLDELKATMRSDARDAERAGLLVPGSAASLAEALMTAYYGAVLHWCSSARCGPLPKLLAPLVDTCIRAVSSPRAEAAAPSRARRARQPR